MNNYTIYCTEEQTKKAFVELDAPLKQVFYNVHFDETLKEYHLIRIGCKLYEIPTAEQMIGWLQDQGIGISIKEGLDRWFYLITDNKNDIEQWERPTRKETTLAAIDAALEYLMNNKK